jgi:hypothetical protein
MSTSPENERDYLQIEDDFTKAQAIVSSLGDLLGAYDRNDHTLADITLVNAGAACFENAEKMKSLFYEVLDMYLDKKKAHQK